ncbi:hypothetical protein CPC08DRAFT_374712 [Agrocybe pediades]|nr:hypothetical protein CPC08DRAFT_374712 [Agrocybe pediades]
MTYDSGGCRPGRTECRVGGEKGGERWFNGERKKQRRTDGHDRQLQVIQKSRQCARIINLLFSPSPSLHLYLVLTRRSSTLVHDDGTRRLRNSTDSSILWTVSESIMKKLCQSVINETRTSNCPTHHDFTLQSLLPNPFVPGTGLYQNAVGSLLVGDGNRRAFSVLVLFSVTRSCMQKTWESIYTTYHPFRYGRC